MILSIDEVERRLNEMAETFPKEFYSALNGGILLLPDCIREDGDLYTMGLYCNDQMGRYIQIFHGSFVALAQDEDWTDEDWKEELYETLAHEFTHHIENLAGERGLEIKDEMFMEQYRDEH